MANVVKRIKNDGIIIMFVVAVLVSSFYMGVSERKLATESNTYVEVR